MTDKHPRQLIREAFSARLMSATSAEDRVFPSRITPITNGVLPAILIYTREEKVKEYSPDGEDGWIERELQVIVEGAVKGGETVDDKLDALGAEIEGLLLDWQIPGRETAKIRLHEVQQDVIAEGSRPVGAIGLVFEVCYRTPWRVQPADRLPDHIYRIIHGIDETPFELPHRPAPDFPGVLGNPNKVNLP